MGDYRRQEVAITYPAEPDPKLTIEAAAPGTINISPGAVENLVSGTIEYSVDEWVPRLEERGREIRLWQSGNPLPWLYSGGKTNHWDLRLGTKAPYSLRVNVSVSRGRWDLGGLPLTDLVLQTGIGENYFNFANPNPVDMKEFDIDSGVGSIEMDGLLNANFQRMHLKAGVGKLVLRFTGEGLRQNSRVRIDGGVGKVDLILDSRVPAFVSYRPGIGSIDAHGDFMRGERGGYETRVYRDSTGPRLEFEISGGIGAVSLDAR
jgi:hypothetical protein